ncbi:MAG: AraC family transcriptional regulator [Lachnospiraceae bacterium]|nr:AraC family transcriptional regulator [Lachnospiraceae bacterium]
MQLYEHYEKLVFQDGQKLNFSHYISADYANKSHWHPFAEMLLSLADGNEVCVNFTNYRLKVNDLVILQPGDLHSINYVSEDSFLIIQFPLTSFSSFKEIETITRILGRYPCIPYEARNADSDYLIFLFKSLFTIYESNESFKELMLASKLMQFFASLGYQLLATHPGSDTESVSEQSRTAKLIAQACMYISDNCTSQITLEDAARHIGISKSYFSHLFKDYTEMTFIDYLTSERIRKAGSLLASSRHKIIDIAFECGFTSISSFNRAFRKVKGISPTEFREKLVQDEMMPASRPNPL